MIRRNGTTNNGQQKRSQNNKTNKANVDTTLAGLVGITNDTDEGGCGGADDAINWDGGKGAAGGEDIQAFITDAGVELH